MTHSDGDSATTSPVDLVACRYPSITETRRSASRWIVTGFDKATKGASSVAGFIFWPSSDTLKRRVCGSMSSL